MTNKAMKVLSFAAICQAAMMTGVVDVLAVSDGPTYSGTTIAGFSVDGRTAGSFSADLTQEKSRYLYIGDLYGNLGVASVEGYLNIRKEPKSEGVIVGKLPAMGACEILSEQDGWCEVSSGSVTGFVSKKYLMTGLDAKAGAVQNVKPMARIEADVLRVRLYPSMDAPVVGKVSREELLEIRSDGGGGWMRIRYDSGEGYIYTPGYAKLLYTLPEAEKVVPKPESSSRQKVVNYAVQFVGNPYVWGGTDPNTGADCSGFVQYVLGHSAGIALNRTSREQAKQGLEVSSSQVQPGDLIFYASQGVIDHVAMYIGNGQIVHAASSRSGIKISSWNYRNPVTIRRMIK